jgi:hypothetical protein
VRGDRHVLRALHYPTVSERGEGACLIDVFRSHLARGPAMMLA